MTRTKAAKKQLMMCYVCKKEKSSNSVARNYGVQSCSGCKSFFRRVCKGEIILNGCVSGKCDISQCTQCRYKNCLAQGMSKDYLRADNSVGGSKFRAEKRLKSGTHEKQDSDKVSPKKRKIDDDAQLAHYPKRMKFTNEINIGMVSCLSQHQLHSDHIEVQPKQSGVLDTNKCKIQNDLVKLREEVANLQKVKETESETADKERKELRKEIDDLVTRRESERKKTEEELRKLGEKKMTAENECRVHEDKLQENLDKLREEVANLQKIKETESETADKERKELRKEIDDLVTRRESERKKTEEELRKLSEKKTKSESEIKRLKDTAALLVTKCNSLKRESETLLREYVQLFDDSRSESARFFKTKVQEKNSSLIEKTKIINDLKSEINLWKRIILEKSPERQYNLDEFNEAKASIESCILKVELNEAKNKCVNFLKHFYNEEFISLYRTLDDLICKLAILQISRSHPYQYDYERVLSLVESFVTLSKSNNLFNNVTCQAYIEYLQYLLKKKRYSHAKKICIKIIDNYTPTTRVYYELAKILKDSKEFGKARKNLEKAMFLAKDGHTDLILNEFKVCLKAEYEVNRWSIMDLEPNASKQEIKMKYHQLNKLYHTDKLAGKSEGYTELCKIFIQQVNMLYHHINEP